MKTEGQRPVRLRIELDGEFWGLEALSLAERLPLCDLAGAECVSLCKVRSMDEAGLAMLVRFYSNLRVRGTRLELTDVPVFVRELLERAGLSFLVRYSDGSDGDFDRHTIALRTQVKA